MGWWGGIIGRVETQPTTTLHDLIINSDRGILKNEKVGKHRGEEREGIRSVNALQHKHNSPSLLPLQALGCGNGKTNQP